MSFCEIFNSCIYCVTVRINTAIGNSKFLWLTPPIPIYDYNEQKLLQQNYLWHLGKNLSVGDFYTYKIFDPKTIQTLAQTITILYK